MYHTIQVNGSSTYITFFYQYHSPTDQRLNLINLALRIAQILLALAMSAPLSSQDKEEVVSGGEWDGSSSSTKCCLTLSQEGGEQPVSLLLTLPLPG